MTIRTLALLLILVGPPPPTANATTRSITSAGFRPRGSRCPTPTKSELQAGVAELAKEIDALRRDLKGKPTLALLPDVRSSTSR